MLRMHFSTGKTYFGAGLERAQAALVDVVGEGRDRTFLGYLHVSCCISRLFESPFNCPFGLVSPVTSIALTLGWFRSQWKSSDNFIPRLTSNKAKVVKKGSTWTSFPLLLVLSTRNLSSSHSTTTFSPKCSVYTSASIRASSIFTHWLLLSRSRTRENNLCLLSLLLLAFSASVSFANSCSSGCLLFFKLSLRDWWIFGGFNLLPKLGKKELLPLDNSMSIPVTLHRAEIHESISDWLSATRP